MGALHRAWRDRGVGGPRITGWRWLAAAGLSFGIVAAVLSVAISKGTGGLPIVGTIVAAPAFALGARLADRIWRVVTKPTRGRVLAFAILAGLCAPAVTGALDLYLRASTP